MTWTSGPMTAAKMTGMVVVTAATTIRMMTSTMRGVMIAAMKISVKMTGMEVDARFTGGSEMAVVMTNAAPGGMMKAARGVAEMTVVNVARTRATTATAMKALARMMGKEVDASFEGGNEMDAAVMKAAPGAAEAAAVGAEPTRAVTATALKASVRTMVKVADAGFAGGKSEDGEKMAAARAVVTTTAGAVRATVRMTGLAAAVECGERNTAVGVASAVGPFNVDDEMRVSHKR